MILKWNDISTYIAGHPPRQYETGDIISPDIFSPEILKQFLMYGKVIYTEIEKITPVKLSISVMAHPSRSQFFGRLREKLDNPPFSIDQNNNIIENCKSAWMLHDPDADFHIVVQDDAIVCNNFKERAVKFITDRESERIVNKNPIQIYNFFVRFEHTTQMAQIEKQGYAIEARNRGGVAICLPVNQIKSVFEYYDTLTDKHDDERIGAWMMKNKYRVCYSIPCLIDHDDNNTSLVGHNGLNRTAYKFIDNQKLVITKIIHQLWIVDKPAPAKWMQTWRDKNPGWLYRLWTEKELMAEKWINENHIDYYYKNKIWHGVADVARYEILYNYGGCFFDADSECLQPINELFSDNFDAYSCYENERVRPGFISPIMAAVKGSKFAKELIDGISKKSVGGVPWIETGNKYIGEMYKKTTENVKIFPSHYFIPKHFDPAAIEYKGPDKIYALHHFGSTIQGTYEKGIL